MTGWVTRARSPAVVRAGFSVWLLFAAFGVHAQTEPLLSVPDGPLFVEEGETTEIALTLSRTLTSDLEISYNVKGGSGLSAEEGGFNVRIEGVIYPAADSDDYTDLTGGMVTIGAGKNSAAIRIRIDQDDEIDPTRELLGVFLSTPEPGAAYRLASAEGSTTILAIKEGICDRNEQIAEAILDAIPGRSDCADVSRRDLNQDLHPERVESLEISPIEKPLRVGDFWGMDTVNNLDLSSRLSHELPRGVFSGLGALIKLDLSNNTLTTLSRDVFRGIGFLQSGVDANLEELYLNDLPLAGLPDGFFNTFTRREAFVGTLRTDLRGVHLPTGAGGEPLLPLDVGFVQTEEVSTTAVKLKVTVAQGAPYDITADLSVLRAKVSAGDNPVSRISILRGRVESEVFTLTQITEQPGVVVATLSRPPDTTDCRRPSLDEGEEHACYVGVALSTYRLGFRLGSGAPTVRIKMFLEGALE